ncbi:hypothetical protein JXO59_07815 [candidate division KSB1 bacterium]|nr:hypothetical protein [candidate division KSB1 bacterium]
MYKKITLILALIMLAMVVVGAVYSDDKSVTKDKSATCAMHKDGNCPADCSHKETACNEKSAAQCPKATQAKKSACKESACKSTCPAHSACTSQEGKKK